MKQLILVRYGQYENGHLTTDGKATMEIAASRLQPLVKDLKNRLLSASTPRATESAQILSEVLGAKVEAFPALYAAEEEGNLPDCNAASELIFKLGESYDCIVAVISREYIEALPSYILKKDVKTKLERGECLVMNLETTELSYLRN